MRKFLPVLLFLLVAISSIITGHFILSPAKAILVFRYSGYWFILFSTALFTYFLVKALSPFFKKHRLLHPSVLFSKKNSLVALVLIAAFTFIRVHEETEFKIVMDEPALVGTSMSMHKNREVLLPTRAYHILDVFTLLSGYVDKRPTLFPFLVSVVHDISGYRPTNAFVLNFFLTAVFLILAYTWGFLLKGRSAGILSLLLFLSLPLLTRTANGAGFELLNLNMILATMLAATVYLKSPDKASLTLLCLSSVLLAQVRYESVLYFVPVAVIILLGWWQKKQIITSWPFIISPMLLIPYFWQRNTFTVTKGLWQLQDRPNTGSPFSTQYFEPNLGHAVNFFFDFSKDTPNSPFLSIVGSLSLLFFLSYLFKQWKRKQPLSPQIKVFSLFLIAFFIYTLIILFYFYGQLDNAIIRRLSLPMHIPFVLATVWIVCGAINTVAFKRFFFSLTCVFLIAVTLPTITNHTYSRTYPPGQDVRKVVNYIGAHRPSLRNSIVFSEHAVLWIIHEVDAISNALVNQRKQEVKQFMHQKNPPTILVHEVLKYNPETDTFDYTLSEPLAPEFHYHNIFVEVSNPVREVALSKLDDVKEITLPLQDPPRTNDEYLANWAHNLP